MKLKLWRGEIEVWGYKGYKFAIEWVMGHYAVIIRKKSVIKDTPNNWEKELEKP